MDTLTVGLVQINIGWDYEAREAEQSDSQSIRYVSTYILPYSVALLQAYAQKRALAPARYKFLTPIPRRVPVASAVAHLLDADVVGFSAYVWNERLSLEIARQLKQLRPNVLIVFGGPQVPDHAEHFLRQNPQVDVACHGEGEATFLAILEQLPARDFAGVAGVSWLAADGRFVHQPRASRTTDLSTLPSPFLDGTFDAVMQAHPGTRWYLIWETNRGCPFACTFCDWGSAINTKVYTFAMERLRGEIDWMAAHQIEDVYCADANFGMLPRDVEIAEYAVQSRRTHGYPRSLNVQSTKNATERAWNIQKLLSTNMRTLGVTVAFQSLDPHTLKEVRRDNISIKTFQELQRRYAKAGIPTYTDLILGLPGETYASFADGIDRLIRDGQHDRVVFHNCSVLPNAEMASPVYRERHRLQTVPQRILNSHGALDAKEEVDERLEIVVGTATMPGDEWLRAKALSFTVDLLYFDRLLQIPLAVLASKYGVRHLEMIEALAAADPTDYPVLASIQAAFVEQARSIQAGGPEYVGSTDWLGLWWPPDELALLRLGAEGRLAAFYAEAQRLLMLTLFDRDVLVDPLLLHEMVELNRQLLKLPCQDKPVMLTLSHDVWGYYRGILTGDAVPLERRRTSYLISRGLETGFTSWPEWAGFLAGLQYHKHGYLRTPHTLAAAPARTAAAAS